MEALTLIEKCLNGQIATVYDTYEDEQGRERKKVNQEATLVARAKQAEIKTAFEKWLWQDDGPGRAAGAALQRPFQQHHSPPL